MTEQVWLKQINGKTIAKVFADYCEEVLIVFTDATYCVISADSGFDETASIDDGSFSLFDWSQHAEQLFSLGVISQKDVDAIEQHKAKQEEKKRQLRKIEFERLKAEFEQ